MDRRSWLWRRKSSEKNTLETESSGGSVSSHSERFSDDQVYLNQNFQPTEIASNVDARQNDHNHAEKTLSEKLSDALVSNNAKEEIINQHVKIAEEAVSGWEKAEREVVTLKQQVDVLTVKNSTLEDRVVHLDEALKECLRQLRQTREEKEQIFNKSLENKIFEREKENSDLKHKISTMVEELEIRLIERDLSNKVAEQASKQLLNSVNKIAKLEAECRALQKANNYKLKARKTPSVIENGDFKNTGKFARNWMDSSVKIDLMNDFLEMEKLVALPESSEVESQSKKVESLEVVLLDRENKLKEAEYKAAERENELEASRNRLQEVESKLFLSENELEASRHQLEEIKSKLTAHQNELKALRKHLEDVESKYETKLKESRNQLEESEFKLSEHENELQASRTRLEEAEFKLVEHENELKLSRYQLEKSESKLAELEIELNASTYLLEEAEFKLHNTTNRLEMSEASLNAANVKKEEAESQCKALEAEIQILVSKVDYLESNIANEQKLSKQTEAKYRDLKDDVSRMQHEVQDTKLRTQAEEFRFLKIKQDTELALAGSKFSECQKTIASLSRQLQALATLDEFLIDTNEL